ncbi:MAG: hypothetical protein H6667_17575 [Ardenticatenaceae bacterium]|nr:hypothetical protein [Ardenticatenaceae bacterium]
MNDKNRETQLTAEFADLIQTLERPEAKPYTPALAQEEKMKLRRQLLAQEERPFLSRQAVGNLWRFAGTAVFLAVVIIIGAYFWGIFSRPGQVGPGPTTEPQPTATSEPTVAPTAVINPVREGTQFGDELVLTNTEIVPMPDGLSVALDWFVAVQPEQDYTIFFHLLDAQGELVAQLDPFLVTLRNADSPSQFTSDWAAGETIRQIYSLRLLDSATIGDGQYDLVMGLYDVRTGERLSVTAVDESQLFDNGTAVFLGNWDFGNGPFNDEATPADSSDRIWLIDFTQKARPSSTSPIEFDVTLGHDLISETGQDVFLKLAYAHPEWQSVGGNGRVPVDDTGDLVILDPNQHTISLTFTGSPAEIEQITGTDTPVFMAQMGYFVDHDDARGREFVFLATETFDSYNIDLTSTDTIYQGQDNLEVSDVMPAPGSTITVAEPIPFFISVDYSIRSVPAVLMDAIMSTPIDGQLHEVISGTLALESGAGGGGLTLYIMPEQLQSLPVDPAELVLQVQLRMEGEERPYLIRQPEDYHWTVQQ